MCGWYRIDPSNVEEAITIHKTLMLAEYVNINRLAVDNLKLTMQVNECINDFIDTELSNLDELHKYATIIITLTGILKAYETIFGARLKEGLMEVLNSLGAVPVSDLEQEEGDEDAET